MDLPQKRKSESESTNNTCTKKQLVDAGLQHDLTADMLQLKINESQLLETEPWNMPSVLRNVMECDPEHHSFFVLKDFASGYPQTTDVACWWDCHTFDTQPVGIPQSIHDKNNQISFKTIGCFCSFNCAYAWCKYDKTLPKCRPNLAMLTTMYRTLTNDKTLNMTTNRLTIAPPRLALKLFGGVMDITQFRQHFNGILEYDICLSPMIPLNIIIDPQSTFMGKKYKRVLQPRKANVDCPKCKSKKDTKSKQTTVSQLLITE